MKRFLQLLVLAFIGLRLAAAEQATVSHGVSLRRDPSTGNPHIGHLNRNAIVTPLAKKPRAGFCHVQTAEVIAGVIEHAKADLEHSFAARMLPQPKCGSDTRRELVKEELNQ